MSDVSCGRCDSVLLRREDDILTLNIPYARGGCYFNPIYESSIQVLILAAAKEDQSGPITSIGASLLVHIVYVYHLLNSNPCILPRLQKFIQSETIRYAYSCV